MGCSKCWSSSKLNPCLGFLFLFYINDLSSGLSSYPWLFADDISLFSVFRDMTLTANALNNDLVKINNWAYQWKIVFKPDSSKQAQEAVFFSKN